MPWNYDKDSGIWNGPDGWTYQSDLTQFCQNNQPKPVEDVPPEIRNQLEITAKDLIDIILDTALNDELDPAPVQIQNKFNEGDITECMTLDDNAFGSDGATSQLIVFAVGVQQGQQVAVGAHLNDANIYFGPEPTVNTILQNVGDLDEGHLAEFYVFGGQVGRNTNPGGGNTMDYSLYYPFFLELSERGTIGHYNFPSNGEGNTAIGAAITANHVNVWHDIDQND